MRKRYRIAGVLVAAMVASAVGVPAAFAADHFDSPSVDEDPAADITDVYAFRSSENPANLVVALDVNPFVLPGAVARNFSPDVNYSINVDTNGDLKPDATVNITFSAPAPGKPQTFTITGLGANPITGQTTAPTPGKTPNPPQVTTAGPIKVFAGLRDDPFFFDLVGFQRFLSGPFLPAAGLRPAGDKPVDTFAGFNVGSIVIELPITALTGAADANTSTIKAWVATSRKATTSRAATGDTSSGNAVQIDRMGIPAINTALIPADKKDAFNRADPANDIRDYRATAQATITALRSAVGSVTGFPAEDKPGVPADTLATVLIPDVVTIDFSKPVQFPNGRRLQDDVIDAALGLVLNRGNVLGGGPGVSDGVNANDVAFLNTFPYLAPPHQPGEAAASAAPATVAPTPEVMVKEESSGVSKGALIGAIIGSIAGGLIIGGAAVGMMRRKKA
ncbi:MAG: DUF4331 domain-containing protein [Chloroflexi bacterium]|nr:DUF4331 domain-containing protein [Chloroflexota bacterium]